MAQEDNPHTANPPPAVSGSRDKWFFLSRNKAGPLLLATHGFGSLILTLVNSILASEDT